ncbi:MAG: type IV secretion system DNA-binding domain-containing protein [Pseudomonadota bacterium]
MKKMMHFPKILVRKTGKGFEGVAGLKLKSILKADLVLTQLDFLEENQSQLNPLNPKRQHRTREALLHAISSWPPSICLELHLTALPDLIHKARGQILISIFLRALASTQEEVKEEIIRRYLNLVPLLASHIKEAEFVPITVEDDLRQRRAPFSPTHALAIHRRQEDLSLSTPLKRLSMGFGSMAAKGRTGNNMIKHLFPWIPSLDDWAKLMDTLVWQLDPIQIIVRLRPGAEINEAVNRLGDTIRTCELFLSGIKEFQITLKRQTNLIRDVALKQITVLRESCFNLGVFILAPNSLDTSLENVLGKAIIGSQGDSDDNSLFQGGFTSTKVTVKNALRWDYFLEKEPFTISEAACAFRLPSPPMEDHAALPVKRSRTCIALLPPVGPGENGCIELAINEHQGIIQPVTVGTDERMSHTFIIGQTSTGKSTLMERMILQDIRAGRGLAVIDPHGDMVDSILGRVPEEREEDVIIFDMLDREKPLGFNLIQWKTPEERDLIIDELFLALDRIYDMKITGGPIFETNFRGMLKLLMGEKSTGDFVTTILEFASCYLNKGFRRWLVEHTQDPKTLDFVEELERTGGDASLNNLSPYITSKLSRFTNDTTLMRIVGQEKTSFDFDEIMDKGKILLLKLGKGRFGAMVSALLANQIVARFKLAAMKRGKMRAEERRDFFLYVDECHVLPSENFMELLSEARKFKMGLVLATQYAAQLGNPTTKENDLLSAILGNVGTTLIFRLGQTDATQLAPALHPYFTSLDIIGLPNWRGYARLQAGRDSTPPFSFRTQIDETPYNEKIASKIQRISREKYGMDATSVDEQILKRRSIWKED